MHSESAHNNLRKELGVIAGSLTCVLLWRCVLRVEQRRSKSRSLKDAIAATKIGTTKASFVFHHANAWFDAVADTIHTDSVCYSSFPDSFAVRERDCCAFFCIILRIVALVSTQDLSACTVAGYVLEWLHVCTIVFLLKLW